jgi:hypothetical protein
VGDGEAGVGVGGEVRVEVGVDVDVEGGVGSDGRSSSTPIAMPNVASRTLESKRVRMRARAGHPPSNHWEVEMPWRRLPDPRLVSVLALGASLMSGCACESVVSVTPRDAGGPDAYRPPVGRYDECGNGLDDDGDGAIDEDCPCGTDEVQPCWDGARAERGVGACGDGMQQCSATGSNEFGRWLACTMSRGPGMESCEGSADEDCDGAVDEGCTCTEGASRPCTGPSEGACSAGTQTCRGGAWTSCEGAVGPVAEVCSNGVDDDCDGVSDDPSFCSCSPSPEVCGNGADDDCDGTSDESPCAMPTPDAGMPDAGMGDAGICTGNVVQIARNGDCVLQRDGTVSCRGEQPYLGDGSPSPEGPSAPTGLCRPPQCRRSDVHVRVPGLDNVVSIYGDSTIFALTADGSVFTWGLNGLEGRSGLGFVGGAVSTGPYLPDFYWDENFYIESPTRVPGLPPVSKIATVNGGTCALTRAREVYCWGVLDASGDAAGYPPCGLGGTTRPQLTARRLDTRMGTAFTDLAGGGGMFCFLRDDGRVACMGNDGLNGTATCRLIPSGNHLRFMGEGPFSRLYGTSARKEGIGGVCAMDRLGQWTCRGGGWFGRGTPGDEFYSLWQNLGDFTLTARGSTTESAYPLWASGVAPFTDVVWAQGPRNGLCYNNSSGVLECESRPAFLANPLRDVRQFLPPCAVVGDGCLDCYNPGSTDITRLTFR